MKSNHLLLYVLIAAICLVELTLTLADLGLVGDAGWRQFAYDNGAFWPGLLGNWQPNYAAQPYTMFFTYAFLHGGLIHLSVNMISIWSLGRAVLQRTSQGYFLLLYFASSLTGAAGFALLASGPRPMVGASGSLFGLLAAHQAWEYMNRESDAEGLKEALRFILLLSGLNLLIWWAMSGQLAWQTHLGGAIGGWIGALLIDRWQRRA